MDAGGWIQFDAPPHDSSQGLKWCPDCTPERFASAQKEMDMPEIIYAQERNMAIQFDELRKAAPHRCLGGWSCESHVMEPMNHEIDGVECGGAGEPCPNADGPGFPDCPSSIEPST